MPTLDELADPALAAIVDEADRATGTAFRVTQAGTFITCHHCVRGEETVRLRPATGELRVVECQVAHRFPEVDLALLRCSELAGPALAVVRDRGLSRFWTKGFAWQSSNVVGAMPREGQVHGRVSLSYQVAEDRYELPSALVLGTHHSFDSGLSGAPVFDADEQVVVGVVTTKYKGKAALDGFGVPFADAADRCTAIGELLDENRRSVPCPGRYLNAGAARALCRRQRERAVAVLAASGRALPESYVRRSALAAAVDDFLAGERPILPVVGPSGVGKTAALAALASAPPAGCEPVLVEGSSLRDDEKGLAEALRELGDADRLVAALAEDGATLLILLDALNEAPPGLKTSLGAWWGHTAVWLRDAPVKLIVTAREDFWAFASRHVDEGLAGTDKDWVALTDFADDEAQRALAAYGLTGRGLRPEDVRHPFVLRVYAELGTRSPSRPLSRYQAVERYVQRKCEAVAAGLGGGVGVPRVQRVLRRIAEASAAAGGSHLPEDDLEEICAAVPGLEESLISEHLLMPVYAGGVSFAFDQVPEYLAAVGGASDPGAVADNALAAAREHGLAGSLGRHVYGYLRLEEHDQVAFRRAVERLVTELGELGPKRDEPAWLGLHVLINEVFEAAREPAALADELVAYARLLREHWLMIGVFIRSLSTVPLPLKTYMRLVHALIPTLRSYGHRRQDGARLRAQFDDELSPLSLLVRPIRESPRPAFELMRPWLADNTRLREGHEATVADVAVNVLCHFAQRMPPELLDELAAGPPEEQELLHTIAERTPEVAVALCPRYAAAEDPALRHTALTLADEAVHRGTSDEQRAALLNIPRRLYREPDPDAGVRESAFRMLLSRTDTVGEVIDDALDRLEADAPVDLAVMAVTFRHDPRRVFPALMECARSHPNDTEAVLNVLRNEELTPPQTEELLALAEEAHTQGRISAAALALTVEYRLYDVRDDPPPERLVRLARGFYTSDEPHLRDYVSWFVTGQARSGTAAQALRQELAALTRDAG